MSTTVDNQIINLQFNNKDFEKNASQSLKTVEKLKKNLDFNGVKTGFETIASGLKKVTSTVSGAVTGIEKFYNVYRKLGDIAFHPVRNLKELGANTEAVTQSFSKLEEVSVGALRRLGEQAVDAGERLVKSLTVDQVSAGWEKFGEKTRSVAAIMSATGMSAETVTDKLKKLNWYTDETSYAYTDMTNNIGKFTNAGIELDDAITAMIGIGNAAGLAGASVQDASHAMAGFSGAIAQGYMDRQRWSWIQTAHMDTVQFKEALIDAAVAEGTLEKGAEGLFGAFGEFDDDHIVTVENFENAMTKSKWLTSNVMTTALKRFGGTTEKLYDFIEEQKALGNDIYTSDAIKQLGISEEDLGLKAFKASQEARTLSDAIDSVKDAVSTGFMTAFEHLIGNYEDAKELWTDLANTLWDVFAAPVDNLNSALDEWADAGGFDKFRKSLYQIMDTTALFIETLKQGWSDVFGEMDRMKITEILNPFHNFADRLEASATNGILGKLADIWYNFLKIVKSIGDTFSVYHEAFIVAFTNSGLYDAVYSVKDAFSAVEETINEVSEAAQDASEYVEKAFRAVSDIWTKGSLGNGEARVRALEALGLDPEYVQKYVNQIANGSKKSLDEVHEQMIKDGYVVSEVASEELEEVEEEESEIVRVSSKLGKVLGRVADAIRLAFMDDSVYDTVYDIFLGFWSLVEMIRASIDQLGQSIRDTSGLKSLIHWVIDPIANVARSITDTVANGGLLKIHTIVAQLITLFNNFSAVIKEVGHSGSEAFHNVFGDFDILNFASSVLSKLISGIKDLSNAFKKNNRLTRIFSGIASTLRIVTKLITKLLNKALKPAGKTVLPSVLDALAEIGDVLTSLADDDVAIEAIFYSVTEAFEKAKKVISVVVGVLGSAVDLITSAVKSVINFGKTVGSYISNSKIFKGAADALRNLSEAFSSLFGKKNTQDPTRSMQEFEGELEKGENSFSWLNVMLGVVEALAGAFGLLVTGIANVITWIDQFIDKIQNGNTRSSSIDSKGNIFTSLSDSLSSIFSNRDSKKVIKGSAEFFGDVLTGLSEAITIFFKNTNIDWAVLKDMAGFFAVIWGFIEFRKSADAVNNIIKSIGKVPLSFADIFTNFNDVLSGIKGTVGAAKTAINNITQAQVVESYIYALLAISGAVALLGKIPENQLVQGISAIVVLATFFAVFAKAVSSISTDTKAITKITNSGNKTFNLFSGNTNNVNAGPLGVAMMILSMAAFALAVASAIKKLVEVLANNNVNAIYGAIGILGGFFAAIIALVLVFANVSKKLNNKQTVKFLGGASKSEGPSGVFNSLATVIGTITVAIGVLCDAVIKMAKLPRTRLAEATNTLWAVFLVLGLLTAAFSVLVVYLNSDAKFEGTVQTGENKFVSKSDMMVKQIQGLATAMILIASAIDTLIPAIAAMAIVSVLDSDGRMLQGILVSIGGLMIVMAGIVALFALIVSKTTLNTVKSVAPLLAITSCMVIIAVALDALLPLIAVLGAFESIKPGSIVQIAASIGLILVAMGLSLWLATKSLSKLKSKQILSLAKVVISIAAAFAIIIESLGHVTLAIRKENASIWEFVGVAVTVGILLAGLMTVFAIILSNLNNMAEVQTQDVYSFVAVIIAIAGSLLIISAALSLLAKTTPVDAVVKYAVTLGGLLAVLLGISFLLNKFGGVVAVEAVEAIAFMIAALAGLAVGISASFLLLAVAIKVFADSLPKLIGLLPKFGDSLAQFCEKLKNYKGDLILYAISFTAFAVIIGLVAAKLIASILAMFKKLNDKDALPKIGKNTMMTVAAIVLGICAALTQTSPEILKAIEATATMVMAYLGEIMGALVEAVLVLILEFLDRLADALDNNTDYIWYVIVRVFTSIGNLIMSALGGVFYEVFALLHDIIGAQIMDLVDDMLIGFKRIVPEAKQVWLDFKFQFTADPVERQNILNELDKLDEEINAIKKSAKAAKADNWLPVDDLSLAQGWWKDYYNTNYDKKALQDLFGIEPRDYEDAKNQAINDIYNIGKDYGEKSVTSAKDGLTDGINNVLADIEIPDALQVVFDQSTDDSGEFDATKFGESLGEKLNEAKDGALSKVDLNAFKEIIPAITGEMSDADIESMMNGLMSEYTGDVTDLESLTGLSTANMENYWGSMTESVTGNFDAMATSQQALIEATAEADKDISESMDKSVAAIDSYRTPFYKSGFMLVSELKRGMDTEMGVTKEWLIKQMAEIIDTAYNEWKVSSPSKLFNALGQFAMEGLAIGLQNDMPLKVMQQSIHDIDEAVTFGQFNTITPRISPVVDLSNARQTAAQVDTLFKVPTTSRKIAASASQYVNTAFDYVRNDKYNDSRVVASINTLNSKLDSLNDNMMNTNIYLDSGALVGATSGAMDKALGQRASRIKRGG